MRSLSTVTTALLSFFRSVPPLAPTSKRIFLVRHGKVIPPGGVHGVHYGDLDIPLSPLGKIEATQAVSCLADTPLSAVVSSPLSRAVFGANEIRKSRTITTTPPLTYKGFSELNRGKWRGKTKEQIGNDLYESFNAATPGTTPEDGESLQTVRDRA